MSQLLLTEERVCESKPAVVFLLLVKQPVESVQPMWSDHEPQPGSGLLNAVTLQIQLFQTARLPQLRRKTKKEVVSNGSPSSAKEKDKKGSGK